VKVDFMMGTLPAVVLAVAACSTGSGSPSSNSCPAGGGAIQDQPDGAPPSEYVAYASSFDCFQSWNSAAAVPSPGDDDAGDGLHGIGPLQAYWNQSPPHGSTAFPVGTIIVKETQEADVTQRIVFAMVKRGDGYNTGANVANGWEWFSLQNNTDGSVDILWRGLVAPAGQTYAGQAIGDCNGCHSAASANDSVWDEALQLSSF
jgi:hypothetical protein